jgi:hypothetical protein
MLLRRIAGGEKLEKATPFEMRFWCGVFVVAPASGGIFLTLASRVLDQGTFLAIWSVSIAYILALSVSLYFWARFVAARFSLALGAGVWAVLLWYMWHRFA